MSDLERDLGLQLPSLGTLEIEGIPIEGGDAVIALHAELPKQVGRVTMHMSLDAAEEAFNAGLQIIAQIKEMT